MSTRQEENDIYIMPPNFIDTGTVFGGTIKFRNAAEALAVSLLIGINGDSLTSFVINFFVYLKNRRVVGMQEDADEAPVKERKPAKQHKARSKKVGKK